MKLFILTLFFILQFKVLQAQEQKFDLIESQRRSAKYIYMEGVLPEVTSTQGIAMLRKLRDAVASGSNIVLVLNMDGGDVETAYLIRDLIKRNQEKIRTVLPNASVCTSACIPIYTADESRCSSAQSVFGFHSCRTEGKPSKEATEEYINKLVQDGVSREWVNSSFRNGNGFNEILKRSPELVASGVTKENCENIVPPAVVREIQQKRSGIAGRRWGAAPWSRLLPIRVRPRASGVSILERADDFLNERTLRIQGPMSLPPDYSEEIPSSVEIIE